MAHRVRLLFPGIGKGGINGLDETLLTHFLHSGDIPGRGLDDSSSMGGASQAKKVVFFFPAFSSQEATAPLGILAVSTPLLNAGYQVKIIDSTITPNFQRRVIEELKDAICLAVSLVTGPMIRETVQIAREVKRLYPEDADRAGRLAPLAAARPDAGGGLHRRGGGGPGRGGTARSGAASGGGRIARRDSRESATRKTGGFVSIRRARCGL